MREDLYLVIMAGGSGTRFWPKSTSNRPKQLLSFYPGGKSLIQQTLSRFDGFIPAGNRMIVTTEKLKQAIRSEVPAAVELLAEPQGRNTAPCVFWAAKHIQTLNPDALMLVMPSDHYVQSTEKFLAALRAGVQRASRHDELVTLGVSPTRPETGYGYLKTGEALQGNCYRVERFVEKPDLKKAREFLESGDYLWNGGMFVWKVHSILKAFDQHMPEMNRIWEEESQNVRRAYPKLTATSIDYGIMERGDNVVTFPLDCGWDDLGSWTSLENMADSLSARKGENIATGGEVLSVHSKGNIVDAAGKMVALLGVEDLIIVEHGNALMIASKSKAQDIKTLVEEMKKVRPDLT